MKSFFLVTIFFSLLCFSCGSSSSSSGSSYQDPHSKMSQEMHSELYQQEMLIILDGKWLIKQINDMPIDSLQFNGKQPFMIIDVTKEALSGNDGCNSFQGKVKVKTDKIIFGPTAGTLMACPHMDISGKIMKSFNEKELTYTLNDALILYEGDQQVMVLKREE